jgi:hypothetical protein
MNNPNLETSKFQFRLSVSRVSISNFGKARGVTYTSDRTETNGVIHIFLSVN